MSLQQARQEFNRSISQGDEEASQSIKNRVNPFNPEEELEEPAIGLMKPEDDFGVSNSLTGESLYNFSAKTGQTKVKPKLDGVEAQAIFDLVNSHEGAMINNGANLLVTSGGKKLFETDENGMVTFSIAQHDQNFSRRQSPISNSMEQLKGAMQAYGAIEGRTKSDLDIASTSPTKGSTLRKSTPGNSTPGNSTPGASTPGNSTPGNSTPGASTPENFTAAPAQASVPTQPVAPAQVSVPAQPVASVQASVPAQTAASVQPAAPTQTALAQTEAPVRIEAPAQTKALAQTPMTPLLGTEEPAQTAAPAQSPMTPLLGTDKAKVSITRQDLNTLGKYYESREYKESNPEVDIRTKTDAVHHYKSDRIDGVRTNISDPNLSVQKINKMNPSPEAEITMNNEDIQNIKPAQEWQRKNVEKSTPEPQANTGMQI
jgi:hypothetical protein